ncbi:MAG: RNA methyltransferase [Marinilabiliaceae bacterium]|nr:RNA methyltransferase [Marinilabiliaceae bacterium]
MKKYRDSEGLFVAEGAKIISDMLAKGVDIKFLVATESGAKQLRTFGVAMDIVGADEKEMVEFSQFTTPSSAIAVFRKPETSMQSLASLLSSLLGEQGCLILALDDIQDPGNMGTIIRIADWYGVHDIAISTTCADPFGAKAVQASMGAVARARLTCCSLLDLLKGLPNGMPIYGTLLEGENIYSSKLQSSGVVLMGNEGHGLSDDLCDMLTHRLMIPPFDSGDGMGVTSESLNVAAATAVVLNEFRRPR